MLYRPASTPHMSWWREAWGLGLAALLLHGPGLCGCLYPVSWVCEWIAPRHSPCQWLVSPPGRALMVLDVRGWVFSCVLAHFQRLLGRTWPPWLCLAPAGVWGALGSRFPGPGPQSALAQPAVSGACRLVTTTPWDFCTVVAGWAPAPGLISGQGLPLPLLWSSRGSNALEGIWMSGARGSSVPPPGSAGWPHQPQVEDEASERPHSPESVCLTHPNWQLVHSTGVW